MPRVVGRHLRKKKVGSTTEVRKKKETEGRKRYRCGVKAKGAANLTSRAWRYGVTLHGMMFGRRQLGKLDSWEDL